MEILKNKRVDLNSDAYMVFDNSTGENKVSIYLNSDISGYFEFKLNQEKIDTLSSQLIKIIIDERGIEHFCPTLEIDLNGFFVLLRFNTYSVIEQLINTMIDLFHGYDQFVKYYFDSDEDHVLDFKEKLDKLRSLGNC
jgi:hypothetical protein